MKTEVQFTDGDVRHYKQVRILPNGWIKATEDAGGSEYYPPHMIEATMGNRVYYGDGKEV